MCSGRIFQVRLGQGLEGQTGKEVSQAFKDILHEAGRDPLNVQTDKGKEFKTSAFEGVAKRRGIEVFSSENDDIKASLVERFQWTLQNIMHHHFTSSRSRSFLKVLPEMVRTYNTTYRLYGTGGPRQSPKLKVGDHVRISETRRTFKKGYLPHWSLEIFRIDRVLPTSPPTYTIVNFAEELQVVQPPTYYDVESILKTCTRAGCKECLVKWAGYPHSFNSQETDIIGAP